MPSYCVIDGDTWESIAQAFETPTSWLLLSNGQEPNASPSPSDPAPGTLIAIPGEPPGHSIAPENRNGLDLGPGGLDSVRIRLHDGTPCPMTNVRYAVRYEGGGAQGTSADGWLTLGFPAGICASVDLQWGAPDERSDHPYRTVLVTDCFAVPGEAQTVARLNNLGYDGTSDLESAVRAFQADYSVGETGLADDGSLPPETQAALNQIFEGDCDATQPPPSAL